jgi:N-acetylglutamate synthase-like GNAT family acetyltransferase
MKLIRIRPAKQKDVSTIDRIIVEWQNWKTPRKESIKRAVKNKELLVADLKGELVGFIHYVMHEDIIDGGLNSFVTCFYV